MKMRFEKDCLIVQIYMLSGKTIHRVCDGFETREFEVEIIMNDTVRGRGREDKKNTCLLAAHGGSRFAFIK